PPAIVQPAVPATELGAVVVAAATATPSAGDVGQPKATAPRHPEPDQLRKELEDSRRTLENLKRERQITRALFEAGAVDLDVGAVLIERELATHPNADPIALVDELRKRKPLLFKRTVSPPMNPPAPPPKPGASA